MNKYRNNWKCRFRIRQGRLKSHGDPQENGMAHLRELYGDVTLEPLDDNGENQTFRLLKNDGKIVIKTRWNTRLLNFKTIRTFSFTCNWSRARLDSCQKFVLDRSNEFKGHGQHDDGPVCRAKHVTLLSMIPENNSNNKSLFGPSQKHLRERTDTNGHSV